MSPRSALPILALLAACPASPTAGADASSEPPVDAAAGFDVGQDANAPGQDAAVRDAATWDAAASLDSGSWDAAPSSRTLLERPLYGTSARNLLLDPFVTGDRAWGHFISFFMTKPSEYFALPRTFESASPSGMAAPILYLTAGGADAGARPARVVAPFLGGAGTFSASLWVNASDASGASVSFASVASRMAVALYDPSGTSKVVLSPVATATQTIAGREWTLLAVSSAPLPHGGWFQAQVTDLSYSWRLAGPEVVADQPAPPLVVRGDPAHPVPATDEDRAAILAYGQFADHR